MSYIIKVPAKYSTNLPVGEPDPKQPEIYEFEAEDEIAEPIIAEFRKAKIPFLYSHNGQSSTAVNDDKFHW